MKPATWTRIGGAGSILAFIGLSLGLFSTGITREVATGKVTGTVTLDAKKPFADATVTLVPAVPTAPGEEAIVTTISATTDKNGQFRMNSVPEGIYFAESSGAAHGEKRLPVQVREGAVSSVALDLPPSIPGLDLYVNQHTFTPAERPEVYVHGLVSDENVSVRVYPFRMDEAIQRGSIGDLISPVSRTILAGTPAGAEIDARIQKYEVAIKDRDKEGVFHESVNLPPLPEGIYLLAVTANKETHTNYLLVSKLALVVKSEENHHLAYVSEIDTGKPVPGVELQSVVGAKASIVATTGPDGTAKFDLPLPTPDAEGESSSSRVVIVAAMGESRAMADVINRAKGETLRGFTKTDRPIYRPGDSIFFQGTLRRKGENGYQLPGIRQVTVEVRNPNDELVKTLTLPVNARGSYSGQFATSPDENGSYQIVTKSGSYTDTYWVPIASYRKPEFRMVVKPQREKTYVGDRVDAKVACNYYFGGPVVGAKLTASVFRRPRWSTSEDYALEYGEDPEESSWNGDYVGSVDGATDGQGEAVLSFDPSTIEPDPPSPGTRRNDYAGDYTYTFQVSATEAGDKYFEASGQIPVFEGDVSMRAETDRWFMAPGETGNVTYTVVDSLTEAPVAGRKITVTYGFERWNKNNVTFEPLAANQEIVTDAKGEAKLPIKVDRSGWLRIDAQTTDSGGRKISASTSMDVWSGAGESNVSESDLQVLLDKKKVEAGGTVKALIKSGKPGGSALITLEHSGIVTSHVVELKPGGTTVDFTIPATALPNAVVRAVYVHSKQVYESEAALSVPRTQREIRVEVQSGKAEYHPGDTVDVAIRTRDSAGNPVPAEVSLGVVDEAVFAILEDRETPIKRLYPFEYSNVTTTHSLTTLYLDGGSKEGKSTEGKMRQRFVDTAYWAPQVWTGDGGFARLTFTLPDNLTSFRATATAISADTRCGQSKQSFVVAKELMARISPPPAMVEGDEVRLTVALNSRLAGPTPVKVRLEGDGVTIAEQSEQTVTVSKEKAQQVPFTIRVSQAGKGMVRVRAEGGGFSDAMEMPITIARRARFETDAKSDTLTNSDTIFKLPGLQKGDTGELHLSASASLAGPLLEGLDGLIDYPYGCVEQTMSRFVPAVVARRVIDDLRLPKPAKYDLIPEVARRSLVRLRTFQQSDGGWGWWQYDTPEPEMTAVVLEGLSRARDAGVAIDEAMLKRGIDWSIAHLKQAATKQAIKLEDWRLAYALSLYASLPEIELVLNAELKDSSQLDRRHRILAFLELGKRGNADAMNRARELWTKEVRAPGKPLAWEDYRFTEVHARNLEILLGLGATPDELDREVQDLVQARRGDQWVSTRDTATALAAVAARLRSSAEAKPSGEIVAEISGREVGRLAVTPENFLQSALTLSLAIPEGPETQVKWRATGSARFYISAYTRRYRAFDSAASKPSQALKVERTFHTLGAERQTDGTLQLAPSRNPLTEFASGAPILCRVSLTNSQALSRILVVVPIPSNCHIAEDEQPDSWNWWFTGLQVFDDRAAFFISQLESGTRTIEFHLRAETPGKAIAMPASAEPMYYAGMQASSDSQVIEVRP